MFSLDSTPQQFYEMPVLLCIDILIACFVITSTRFSFYIGNRGISVCLSIAFDNYKASLPRVNKMPES